MYSDQVKLINTTIDRAKPGSSLHCLPHVADPSADVVDVLITCMEWNIATRQTRIQVAEDELPGLQDKAVELLDLLKCNLPDKSGEKGKWNFEKAHSILHKAREIILWGNSNNTTCQRSEVCIDISKYIQLYITMYLHIPSIYTYVLEYT
jgi:hypothetical protein